MGSVREFEIATLGHSTSQPVDCAVVIVMISGDKELRAARRHSCKTGPCSSPEVIEPVGNYIDRNDSSVYTRSRVIQITNQLLGVGNSLRQISPEMDMG
jgi:hypothetical protein